MTTTLCGCGEPLHYTDSDLQADVQALVDRHGSTVRVQNTHGTWHVPRHFIALHGLEAKELQAVADRYGFQRYDPLEDD